MCTRDDGALLAGLDRIDAWQQVIDGCAALDRPIADDELTDLLTVFADYFDAKATWFLGHSRAVADLAAAAARESTNGWTTPRVTPRRESNREDRVITRCSTSAQVADSSHDYFDPTPQTTSSVADLFLAALIQRDFATMTTYLAPEVTLRGLIPPGPFTAVGLDPAIERFRGWVRRSRRFHRRRFRPRTRRRQARAALVGPHATRQRRHPRRRAARLPHHRPRRDHRHRPVALGLAARRSRLNPPRTRVGSTAHPARRSTAPAARPR